MARIQKKLFKIDTHSYGVFYRYASNPVAAKSRVVYEIFGQGYGGWEHDYWDVCEVPPKGEQKKN